VSPPRTKGVMVMMPVMAGKGHLKPSITEFLDGEALL
jgi:hypothetical protein